MDKQIPIIVGHPPNPISRGPPCANGLQAETISVIFRQSWAWVENAIWQYEHANDTPAFRHISIVGYIKSTTDFTLDESMRITFWEQFPHMVQGNFKLPISLSRVSNVFTMKIFLKWQFVQ